jgi:hypothetical protein
MSNSSNIKIRPIGTKDLQIFLDVPVEIYKDDPNWIHPLDFERKEALSPKKNPYFNHAEVAMWVAYKDDVLVGRISAQIDQLSLELINPNLGHFGLFECIDDVEVSNVLFETASNWLRERGMKEISGPYDLSINEMCGLLVDGFVDPPMLMMGHALPYYKNLVETAGFEKEKDLLAYFISTIVPWPDKFLRYISMAEKNKNIEIRELDKSRYMEEIESVFDIFNDGWSGNWGFIPFTKEEAKHSAKALKPIVRSHRAMIANYKGNEVAFMITVPDVNSYINDLKGKLFPFGWAKLLWRIFRNDEYSVRTPLLGIRKEIQNTPYGGLMAILLIDRIRRNIVEHHGARRAELSWILEDNVAMRRILEESGAKIYKTYRIYKKNL